MSRHYLKVLLLIVFLTVAAFGDGGEPAPPIPQIIEQGTAARTQKDFFNALLTYFRALEIATADDDKLWSFRSNFYLGLTKQEAAESAGDPERRTLLGEAKEFYARALALNPTSTATLSNLADAQLAEGDTTAAIDTLECGLAILPKGEARALSFRDRLGDAYLALGERKKAAEVLRDAARSNSDDRSYHARIAGALIGDDTHGPLGRELADYLFESLGRNDVDRVIDAVFDAFERPQLNAEDATRLLPVLAEALSKKGYDLSGLAHSHTGDRLTAVAEKSPYREAFEELKILYLGGDLEAGKFPAWQSDTRDNGHPSPRDAFGNLARSLGSSSRHTAPAKANAYFMLALQLSGDAPDPVLSRDFVVYLMNAGERPAVDAFVEKHARLIAMQEARAPVADLENYYTFYRLVAAIYDNSAIDGHTEIAIDALEHATSTAARASHTWQYWKDAYPDHTLFSQLALLQAKRGHQEKAREVSLHGAQTFTNVGWLGEARELVAEIDRDQLNEQERMSYDAVIDQAVVLRTDVSLSPSFSQMVKRNLFLLSERVDAQTRQRAANELENAGVVIDLKAGTCRWDIEKKVCMPMPLPFPPTCETIREVQRIGFELPSRSAPNPPK
jgi:tetratricopeptide (TPR) repeat protein